MLVTEEENIKIHLVAVCKIFRSINVDYVLNISTIKLYLNIYFRKEIKEGALLLTEKLKKYKPKIAVFNGKGKDIPSVYCI